jgi:hypothetical protein
MSVHLSMSVESNSPRVTYAGKKKQTINPFWLHATNGPVEHTVPLVASRNDKNHTVDPHIDVVLRASVGGDVLSDATSSLATP